MFKRTRKTILRAGKRVRYLRMTAANLGLPAAGWYWLQSLRRKFCAPDKLLTLRSRFAEYPLFFRAGSTDLLVFRQIFAEREYSCLDNVATHGLIIDCGANVGFSSAYLLTRFPRAAVIAVEPDAGNCQVLRRNLAPYGSRAQVVPSAVWSHPARLTIAETRHGSGGEWGYQVRECLAADEPGFDAVDIGTLLRGSGHQRIAVLKIDIEGAECVLFSANFDAWIDQVDSLVIELHPDSVFGNGVDVFMNAIDGRGFTVTRHGELAVCLRTGT
ncbi:MAG: hypothetical protein AMXMBFR8_30190 [Nevskiales bacterium]